MAGTDLQWKYQNNKIVGDGYIRAEICEDDCPQATKQFYVATVPEGAIFMGMIAVLQGWDKPAGDAFGFKVAIGMNDCVFCPEKTLSIAAGKLSVCTDDCTCMPVDQDYLVRVTLDDDLPEGCLLLLLKVILPENVVCESDPVKLCYENSIIDPCTGECACETPSCGPVVVTTVVASEPATAAVADVVTGTITITNTGTLAAEDVTTTVDLPAGIEPTTESYDADKGTYNPSTNKWSIPRLAVGEVAVLTIKGRLLDTVVFKATRAEALSQENTSPANLDTLTDTTTKT